MRLISGVSCSDAMIIITEVQNYGYWFVPLVSFGNILFLVIESEPRALYILCKCSTTKPSI